MWRSFVVSGVLIVLLALAFGCNGKKTHNKGPNSPPTPSELRVSDYGELDKNRVEAFLRAFKKPTLHGSFDGRSEELDKRIRPQYWSGQ